MRSTRPAAPEVGVGNLAQRHQCLFELTSPCSPQVGLPGRLHLVDHRDAELDQFLPQRRDPHELGTSVGRVWGALDVAGPFQLVDDDPTVRLLT